MKNIIKNLHNGLTYAQIFNNVPNKSLIYNDLLTRYKTNSENKFWKKWVITQLKEQSLGVNMGVWNTQFKSDDRENIKESNHLLYSLPLVLENLHLSDNQMKETIINYSTYHDLHVQTFVVLKMMHKFMYELLFYKDKEEAYSRMSLSSFFSGDQEFPLVKMYDDFFLTQDLSESKHSEHAPDIWILLVQCFMNTSSTHDALEMAFKKYDLNATGMLLLGAIANMYYQDVPEFEVPKWKLIIEESLQAFEIDYADKFEFPQFKNPIEKYTINELNRMNFILEGKNPNDYLFDPSLEKLLDDEDQAHNEDYTLALLLAEVTWGIKLGYINENAHVFDLHKYRFDPDSLRYADYDVNDGGFLDMYTIQNLKEMYHLHLFTPYIK